MSAFEIYLRTGLLVKSAAEAEAISFKFNPWHDPQDGRFTTAGAGIAYGEGGSVPPRTGGPIRRSEPARSKPPFRGHGGSFGGGGATGTWPTPAQPKPPAPQHPTPAPAKKPTAPPSDTAAQAAVIAVKPAAKPAVAPYEIHHTIRSHGYSFDIDKAGRTRRASGDLHVSPAHVRSRAAQASAGGTHRKPGDDGGHYIAARFDGPRERFNHFAQDRNFNRGAYRKIENGWASDLAKGHKVFVRITSGYSGGSHRPDTISVFWTVDGHEFKKNFNNRKEGKSYGYRAA